MKISINVLFLLTLNIRNYLLTSKNINKDLISITSSAGTASSTRQTIYFYNKNYNNYYYFKIINALRPVFHIISNHYDILRELVYFKSIDKINGENYIVFSIKKSTDPGCCSSLRIAIKGGLDSDNQFKPNLDDLLLKDVKDFYSDADVDWVPIN